MAHVEPGLNPLAAFHSAGKLGSCARATRSAYPTPQPCKSGGPDAPSIQWHSRSTCNACVQVMYHSQERPQLSPSLVPWDIHMAKVMQTFITLGSVGDHHDPMRERWARRARSKESSALDRPRCGALKPVQPLPAHIEKGWIPRQQRLANSFGHRN